ncbi:MAG: hypothetical protein A2Z18_00570 [Armatimonadetes bacterium RBG_16_58_9]|nr:MAG: hypothetical protein A2Z18_00570 [Armatimonadetes bacterium RBG_16_58_9]
MSASGTIANNIIRGNRAAGGYGFNYGGGLYAQGSSLVVVGNVFLNNKAKYGAAIYFMGNTGGDIANNTILRNVASEYCGGIYMTSGSPALSNNIVFDNTGGGIQKASATPTFTHNLVHGNTGYDYSWTPIPTEDLDPGLDPMISDSDWHIPWGSPCRDAGDDSVSVPDRDIDANSRRNGTIDIGAHETTECWRYVTTVTPEKWYVQVDDDVTVTVNVKDSVTQTYPEDHPVDFSVDAGEIVSISGGEVDNPPTTGYGTTDENGDVVAVITRNSGAGWVTVTASADQTCGGEVSKSIKVYFYDPAEAEWPMFMHDPQHTGVNPVPDETAETLTLAWSTPTSGADEVETAETVRGSGWSDHNDPGGGWIFEHPFIDSSPVVFGSKVVVGTWTRGTQYPLPDEQNPATGSVKGFNGETGARLWTATGDPAMGGVAATPCIWDGKVYVGTTNGYLYCLDIDDGSQVWEPQPTYDRTDPEEPSKIVASAVVHNGVVYVGNEAAKIYAFEADTGDPVDGSPIVLPIEDHGITSLETKNMTGVSSPAIATVGNVNYLLFGCDDGYLYRLRLSDRDLTGVDLTYCVESSPTVMGDEVFIGISHNGGNQVYRLSINPLGILTSQGLGAECRATIAHCLGHLYVGVDTGYTFHKLEPDTMVDVVNAFQLTTEHYFVGSAAVSTGGIVYVGNDDGNFYALSASNLEEIATFDDYEDPWGFTNKFCSSPAIAFNVDASHNRWVYVTTRADHGRLLAFKTIP